MEDSDSNDEALEFDIVNSDNENENNENIAEGAPPPGNARPPRMFPFFAQLHRVFRPNAAVEDDEDEQAEASHVEEGTAVPFDTSLPAQHAYLGAGQEVSGRTILDEDLVQSLPLLAMPGFVLVPNQVFPLTLFHPAIISMMKTVLAANKTFGVVSLKASAASEEEKRGELGTTAEIFEYREESQSEVATVGFMLKARGRQRFRLRSVRRQVDGNIVGKDDVSIKFQKLE